VGLIEKKALVAAISPPLDPFLANQLVDEFVALERRFIQRDWEPAELDSGQFCEILARIIYQQDSGNANAGKDFQACCIYIEGDQNPHKIAPRGDAINLIAILKAVYKLRSKRGAVHISPTYGPNQMDAKFMIEAVRWGMNETLRIFWQGDKQHAAKAIREILQFDVPCIGVFDDVIMVQRTDLTPTDEILVLLHFAGEAGFSRKALGQYSMAPPQRVSDAIRDLCSPSVRQAVKQSNGNFRLTDLGSRHVRENLSQKLLVQ
jgi:hypothetical protein